MSIKELRARGKVFLPAQMSRTDSLRIGASLQKPIAQAVGGGGGGWGVWGDLYGV